jgi:NAD(P)-dependent dehydrogenase (short-subunit alcohol dehydrogenase family)
VVITGRDSGALNNGRIDVWVNNAGINIAKPTLEVTEEDWDRVLDTNLKGTFFACQRAGEVMIRQGGGKIINIASQMAFVGYYKRAAYCSSKGGVVQLTKALAVEWAQEGVLVNAVAPTFIETELTAKMLTDSSFMDDILRRIPIGRMAKPRDVTGPLFTSPPILPIQSRVKRSALMAAGQRYR